MAAYFKLCMISFGFLYQIPVWGVASSCPAPAEAGAAEAAGARVEDYGPLRLTPLDSPLQEGMSVTELLNTPRGQLTPPTVLPTGARLSVVTRRTVEDSPALSMQKRLFVLPSENARLRDDMMREWQNSAFSRFRVQLSPSVRTRGAED